MLTIAQSLHCALLILDLHNHTILPDSNAISFLQDLERVRREGASPKDVEKAEIKLRKSYDEYKNLLEKYNNIREEFEKYMTVSCKVCYGIGVHCLCAVVELVGPISGVY